MLTESDVSFFDMIVSQNDYLIEAVSDTASKIKEYKMLCLEKNNERYFFAVGLGKFEAIHFIENRRANVVKFPDYHSLDSFISERKSEGFSVIKHPSGIKTFLKKVLRGVFYLVIGVGVASVVLALVVIAKIMISDAMMSLPEEIYKAYVEFNGLSIEARSLDYARGSLLPFGFMTLTAGWFGLSSMKK